MDSMGILYGALSVYLIGIIYSVYRADQKYKKDFKDD